MDLHDKMHITFKKCIIIKNAQAYNTLHYNQSFELSTNVTSGFTSQLIFTNKSLNNCLSLSFQPSTGWSSPGKENGDISAGTVKNSTIKYE